MNRVRTLSLIAATLGVAVGAGTLFQQELSRQEVSDTARTPADTSLVRLASAGTVGTDAEVEPELQPEIGLAAPRPAAAPGAAAPDEVTGRPLPIVTASLLPDLPHTVEPLPETAHAAPVLAAAPERAPASAEPATLATDPALIEDLLAEVDACAVWLVVTPEAGAMLDMSLYAPCDSGEPVIIGHAGLHFDARISVDGQLALSLPALSPEAELSVTFADGRVSTDATFVADAHLHGRLGVQWRGQVVLGLNAYASGADFGSAGHIHPANPAAPDDPAHGFLTLLGETMQAQVYSYPSALPEAGEVALELEVAITDESCGHPFHVTTIEARAGTEANRRDIRLEMPDCDGQGGYLVLKNLLPEQTIALN